MEKETWEEEFEKWVIKDRLNYISNRVYAPPLPYYEDIKSFIRQALASQKEKMLGVLEGMKKKTIKHTGNAVEDSYEIERQEAYDQAIDDIISLWK